MTRHNPGTAVGATLRPVPGSMDVARTERWSGFSPRMKGLIVIAVQAAATVLIAGVSFYLQERLSRVERSVHRTLAVGETLQELRAIEAEVNGQARGYFFTRKAEFAGRARDAMAAFEATRLKLSDLSPDDPTRCQRLARIAAMERLRTERSSGDIARFASGALSGDQLRGALEFAESERQRLESLAAGMEEDEKALLSEQLGEAALLRSMLGAATAICTLSAVAGGVVLSLLFARGIAGRIGKQTEPAAAGEPVNVGRSGAGLVFDMTAVDQNAQRVAGQLRALRRSVTEEEGKVVQEE